LNNFELNKLPVSKRQISYLQQTFPLYSNLTAFENVLVSFHKNKWLDKTQFIDKAKDLLIEVGLNEEIWNRRPFSLSGGEAQRVALVKALLKPAKILLLDEPFSNIDKNKKKDLNVLIRDYVKKENIICLYISHDENDLLLMADELVTLDTGIVIQTGTPEQILTNPKTAKNAAIDSIVGLQVVDKKLIDKHLKFNLSPVDEEKVVNIGWRPDVSTLSFDNANSVYSGNKLNFKVRINFIKKIGKIRYYNLSLIDMKRQFEIWHQSYSEYGVNDLHGSIANLIVDSSEIFLLDKNGNIIQKGINL